MLDIGKLFGGAHGVLQKHGNGHRTDPAGIGRDLSRDGLDAGKINIARQTPAAFGGRIRDAVDSHVNHDRAGLDHVRLDKFGRTEGGDQNIGPAAMGGNVARLGMADRDRGAGVRRPFAAKSPPSVCPTIFPRPSTTASAPSMATWERINNS